MKQLLIISLLIPSVFEKWVEVQLPNPNQSPSAQEVLGNVSKKLNNLKSLQYRYRRELNYSDEGYYNVMIADSYLSFSSADTILEIKYQIKTEDFLLVFNGSEKFECDKKRQILKVNNKPIKESFSNFPYLYNSPLSLKNALPAIIADASILKTISDTVIDNKRYYAVKLSLKNKALTTLGNIINHSEERQLIYQLLISKDTYLPMEVLQTNNKNKDYIKVNFDDLKENASVPVVSSWYYSSYLGEYKLEEPTEEKKKLIAEGQQAPDWKLPTFATEESVRLSQFKGKVVMLEFWISNCGFCIKAVPKLNAITDKYKTKKFKFMTINTHDTKEIINLFIKKNQPIYPILYQGAEVANSYGIYYFPSIVLIDKKGKIIYSGHFDHDKIISLVDKNL